MTRPRLVEFHPQAIIEAREARLWYALRDRRVASAFVAELEHAIDVIAEARERWPRFLHDARRYVLRRDERAPQAKTPSFLR